MIFLVFNFLKMCANSKNDHYKKYCPAAIGTDFSTKFLIDTNLQKIDQI